VLCVGLLSLGGLIARAIGRCLGRTQCLWREA